MKIKFVLLVAIVFGLIACENEEFRAEDFGTTSVYFPYQTPVRTLILGEYDLGFNDNDNNGRFEIGVVMSGVFENQRNRQVSFEVAPDLIDANLIGVDSVNVQALPASYYTIEEPSPVTIPAGSINGRIPIQLEDAFFEDPLSYADFGEVHYVLPLRITDFENLDSLLTGVPVVDNPIQIKEDDWNPAPKDYTLFGIKYMNKYQGKYLRRGEDKIVGSSVTTTFATGAVESTDIDTASVYRAEFVERDELTDLTTSGRSSVNYTNRVRRGALSSNLSVNLKLMFNENEEATISNADPDSDIVITGTGRWVEDGDEWGGEPRNVVYLDYTYEDSETVQEVFFGQVVSETVLSLTHTVKDTLVLRNRDVKFEEFTLELSQE